MLGPGGTGPPKSCPGPHQIFRVITVHKLLNTGQLDTVVLLVVASGARPPKYFFLEPLLICTGVFKHFVSAFSHYDRHYYRFFCSEWAE